MVKNLLQKTTLTKIIGTRSCYLQPTNPNHISKIPSLVHWRVAICFSHRSGGHFLKPNKMAFGTLQQYLSQVHAMPKQAVVYARSVTVLVLLHLQVYRSIEEKDGEYLAVSSHWCTYVHWVRAYYTRHPPLQCPRSNFVIFVLCRISYYNWSGLFYLLQALLSFKHPHCQNHRLWVRLLRVHVPCAYWHSTLVLLRRMCLKLCMHTCAESRLRRSLPASVRFTFRWNSCSPSEVSASDCLMFTIYSGISLVVLLCFSIAQSDTVCVGRKCSRCVHSPVCGCAVSLQSDQLGISLQCAYRLDCTCNV